MRFRSSFVLAVLLCWASLASAQNVKNPSGLTFNSGDHVGVDAYEIDIIRKDGVVLQTITVPVANVVTLAVGNSECLVTTAPCYKAALNVQPTAFGTDYTVKVRAVGGGVKSDNSTASNAFDRAPGSPSNTKVK